MKMKSLRFKSRIFILFGILSLGTQAQTLQANMWRPDADVRSLKVSPDGSTVYLAGSFNCLTAPGVTATPRGGLAVSDAGASFLGAFPSSDGTITAIVSDGAGGFIVGGDFTAIGGVSRTNMARILSDGSIDPDFDPLIFISAGDIKDIAVEGDMVFVSGDFTGTVDLTGRDYIFGVDLSDGDLLAGFDPQPDAAVNRIEIWKAPISEDVFLYAGGKFSMLSSTTRNLLGCWKVTIGTDDLMSWNPNVSDDNYPADAHVADMVLETNVSNPKLYIAGKFTDCGIYTRNNVAGISGVQDNGTGTGSATGFDSPLTYVGDDEAEHASVIALSNNNEIVYVSGAFDRAGSNTATRKGAAALYTTGINSNQASAWDPMNGTAFAYIELNQMHSSPGKLFVTGAFFGISGANRNQIAVYDISTGEDNPAIDPWELDLKTNDFFIPSINSAIVCSDGASVMTNVECVREITNQIVIRYNLAALNTTTGVPTSFEPEIDGTVEDLGLTSDGSLLYIGGGFENAAGEARSMLAALNTADGTATDFNENSDLVTSIVELMALATDDERLYVKCNNDEVLAINSDGTLDAGFTYDGVAASNTRQICLSSDNTVLFAGTNGAGSEFSAVDAMTGADATGADLYVNLYSNGGTFGFFSKGNTTYVCGTFEQYDGSTNHSRVVKFVNGVLDDNFRPAIDASVRRCYQHEGVLYLVGQFNNVNGVAREGVAAIDTITGQTTLSWTVAADNFSDTHPRIAINESTGRVYLAERNFSTLCGSAVHEFGSVSQVPTPPTDLYTTDVDLTAATLHWGTVMADNMKIALRRVGATSWHTRSATYADSYMFTGTFAKDADYEWKVKVEEGGVWSEWSAIETFYVCYRSPAAPTGLSTSNVYTNKVTLEWNHAGANEIRVGLRKVGTSVWHYQNAEYIDDEYVYNASFSKNTTYEWMIRVRCGVNWGPWSTTNQFTTGTTAGMIVNPGSEVLDFNAMEEELFLTTYPNPNNGEFTIQASHEGTFKIVNELGQIVQTLEISKENNFETSITGLDHGIYFVTGTLNGETITSKIVVQ